MTDLRGVLPAQRPPVDATVLDEPTSEVPMIRPPMDNGRNGEAGGPAFAEPASELEPAETAVLAAPTDAEPAADPADLAEPEADTTDLAAETTDLAVDTDVAAETTADLAFDTDVAGDTAGDTADVAAETAELVADPGAPDSAEPTAPELTVDTEPGLPEPVEPATVIDPEPLDLVEPAPAPEPSAADLAAETDLATAPMEASPGDAPLTTDRIWDDDPGIPDPADPEVSQMVEPTPPHWTSEMAKMTWSPANPRGYPPEPAPATPRVESEPLSAPVAAPSLAASATGLAEPPVDLAEPVVGFTTPAAPAEPTAVTEPAAVTAPSANPAPGRPGDVAESTIALWAQDAADRLRDQWRDLQVQFIDDPEAAVAGAKGLVTEAVHELADALLEAQDSLDPYRDDGRVDTETMRVAMRRYREFLERVLAL
ncbi:MAG: hypothetical protein GEV12_05335 [Micromonosporaceae bacterium]|nr:hypothetical protein [Micromonosporaceae bacterium]